MQANEKNEEGFTLIEGMITLAIFAFIIYVMMQMQYSLERTMYGGRDRAIAVYLAQEKLEGLKGLSYDDPSLTSGNDTVQGFSRVWTIAVDSPEPKTKTMNVAVSWGTPTKAITLATIITKRNG